MVDVDADAVELDLDAVEVVDEVGVGESSARPLTKQEKLPIVTK